MQTGWGERSTCRAVYDEAFVPRAVLVGVAWATVTGTVSFLHSIPAAQNLNHHKANRAEAQPSTQCVLCTRDHERNFIVVITTPHATAYLLFV